MRVEANAAHFSQQIEQLKSLANDVLRQATAKPADDAPQQTKTPRSIRVEADPTETKLSAKQTKLLNDVFKLAAVGVKFSAPKTEFADFLAQKAQELNQLATRLNADQARFAQDFADGVDRTNQQFDDFAANTADFEASFQEDLANVQDAHANHKADSAQIQNFLQSYGTQTSNLQAVQDNKEETRGIVELRRLESANIDGIQANFVEDRANLAEFQADFVADKTELGARRANDIDHQQEVGKRQENFVSETNKLSEFGEKYLGELKELSNFREAFDANVDNLERHRKAGEEQTAIINNHSPRPQPTKSLPAKTPPAQTQSNIPSEAKAFAAQAGSSTNRSNLSLQPRSFPHVEVSQTQPQPQQSITTPQPNQSVASSQQTTIQRQTTGQQSAQRLPDTTPPTQRTDVSPTSRNTTDTNRTVPTTPQSSVSPSAKSQTSSVPLLVPRTAVPFATESAHIPPDTTDVFQLAGLMTGNLTPNANAQVSAARSDIAAVNAGQAGNLASGFSHLAQSEQKELRRKKAGKPEDDDGTVSPIEEGFDSQS